jgi:DNA-binding PadR family transcriptional regulator
LLVVVDPAKEGFEKVLMDYQIEALNSVWGNPSKGVTSRDVFQAVNESLEGVKTVSRASIINFLNEMCDDKVLNYEEEMCKGGLRRKYYPNLNEKGFKKYIVKVVFESLVKDFPEQTMEVLKESLDKSTEKK